MVLRYPIFHASSKSSSFLERCHEGLMISLGSFVTAINLVSTGCIEVPPGERVEANFRSDKWRVSDPANFILAEYPTHKNGMDTKRSFNNVSC